MVHHELFVNKELFDLLPPLDEQELTQLEANIVKDGRIREAILYWHNEANERDEVLDGHHRFILYKKHDGKYPCRMEPVLVANLVEAKLWILRNQLGRRNLLTPHAQRKMVGELYRTTVNGSRNAESVAKAIAAKVGVSERTVKRDGKRRELVDKLAKPLAKAYDEGKLELSDQQLKVLCKLSPSKQQELARDVRTNGRAWSEVLVNHTPRPADHDTVPELPAETVAVAKESGVKLTPEQAVKLAEHDPDVQVQLVESVAEGLQSLDKAIETGEVPELSIEEQMARHNADIDEFCKAMKKAFDVNFPEGVYSAERRQTCEQQLKSVFATLRTGKCVPCPCGEGCDKCHDLGYLPKMAAAQIGVAT